MAMTCNHGQGIKGLKRVMFEQLLRTQDAQSPQVCCNRLANVWEVLKTRYRFQLLSLRRLFAWSQDHIDFNLIK